VVLIYALVAFLECTNKDMQIKTNYTIEILCFLTLHEHTLHYFNFL